MTEISHKPTVSIKDNGNVQKFKPESLSNLISKSMNNSSLDPKAVYSENLADENDKNSIDFPEEGNDSKNITLESDSKSPEFLHDSLSEDSNSLPPEDNSDSQSSLNSDTVLTENLQDILVEETNVLSSEANYNSNTSALSSVSTPTENKFTENIDENSNLSISENKQISENSASKLESIELSHPDSIIDKPYIYQASNQATEDLVLNPEPVLEHLQPENISEEAYTNNDSNQTTANSALKSESTFSDHSLLNTSEQINTLTETEHESENLDLDSEPTSRFPLDNTTKEPSDSSKGTVLNSDSILPEKLRLDSIVEEPGTLLTETNHASKNSASLISVSSQDSQQSEGGLLNKVRDIYMFRTKSDTTLNSTPQLSESLNIAAFIQKRVRGLSELTSFQSNSSRTLSVNDNFVEDHNTSNFKLQNIPKHVRRMSLLDVTPPTDTRAASLYSVEEHNADDIDWDFWGQLVNNFPDMLKNQYSVLQKSIRQGIPVSMRGMVWQLIADVRGSNLTPVYANLLTKTSPHEKSISQDLPRTFPNLPFFKNREGTGQESLFNVLKCYSLYDPEVGYCQGLSFIAGPLLLNMPDEEAFCILVQMMKDLRQHFTPAMEGLQVRTYQFEKLMEEKVPKVYQHLQEQGIQSTMYASQWFMTLFAYRSSIRLVFRILDILLLEGSDILVKVALALLQDNIDLILSKRFDELISFLKSGIFDQYEDKIDVIIALACDQSLPARRMSKWSQEYMTELAKKAEEEAYAASLQGMNKQLIASNKDLSAQIKVLNDDRLEIAKQLAEAHEKHADQLERNEVLNRHLNELEVMLHTERQKAEAALQGQMDTLAQKNLSLVTKNADLEDALAMAENTIINLKAKLQIQS